MTKQLFQPDSASAQQYMSLQQGSLRTFDFSSSAFLDLASQYCKLFNQETSCIFSDDKKLFGTLRYQMKLMPGMDVSYFAFNDPSNLLSGKTVHSAALTVKHENLALRIKDLCGKEPGNLVTELMLKARESGMSYVILDLPNNMLAAAISKLQLDEPKGSMGSPLIIKIQGAHPEVVSREEFLKEPGTEDIDITYSVMHQAMRQLNMSVEQMNQLLDGLQAAFSVRHPIIK